MNLIAGLLGSLTCHARLHDAQGLLARIAFKLASLARRKSAQVMAKCARKRDSFQRYQNAISNMPIFVQVNKGHSWCPPSNSAALQSVFNHRTFRDNPLIAVGQLSNGEISESTASCMRVVAGQPPVKGGEWFQIGQNEFDKMIADYENSTNGESLVTMDNEKLFAEQMAEEKKNATEAYWAEDYVEGLDDESANAALEQEEKDLEYQKKLLEAEIQVLQGLCKSMDELAQNAAKEAGTVKLC